MFAIIEIGGRQFKVEKGTKIEVETLDKDGDTLTIDKVLLINDGKVHVGKPYLEGAYVEAKIVSCKKGDKVRVYKMHAKKRYHKSFGYRQVLCKAEIGEIKLTGGKVAKKTEPKAEIAAVPEASASTKKAATPKKPAVKKPAVKKAPAKKEA